MYPVLVQLGPVGLRMLPIVVAIGIYAGMTLAAAEFRRRGLDPTAAHDFVTPAVIAGLVGARLFYVVCFDPVWFAQHPGRLADAWDGLAFPGALLAGWAAALWFCRRRRVAFWRFADAAVLGLVLGQVLGTIGAFLHGSGYGTPTTWPWAVVFTDSRGGAPLGVPVHPTQLYEGLGFLVLFVALRAARGMGRDGVLFLLYLSGLVLLAPLEYLRGDALWMADVVPAAMPASLAALVGATLAWIRRPAPAPAGATMPDERAELRPAGFRSAR